MWYIPLELGAQNIEAFCGFFFCVCVCVASLVAQIVKNLPTMQETWVQSWGWKDPLEKGMATHCSILAWRMPWTEEPGRSGVTKTQT